MGQCIHFRNKINPEEHRGKLAASQDEECDKNAALDYAMKSNKKARIAHIELIASCKNLPNIDTFSLPNPLAVLYICKKSVEKAQKMA